MMEDYNAIVCEAMSGFPQSFCSYFSNSANCFSNSHSCVAFSLDFKNSSHLALALVSELPTHEVFILNVAASAHKLAPGRKLYSALSREMRFNSA